MTEAAAHARNLLGPLMHGMFRIRIIGAHRIPRQGGVLVISDEQGLYDAALLTMSLPRPVRVLMESGAVGPLGRAQGRIAVSRDEEPITALRQAVEDVRKGQAVGIFTHSVFGDSVLSPPGAVAAYVQARTGVPTVAVTMFGTHGSRPTDPPRLRAAIDIVVTEPLEWEAPADPLRRNVVVERAERIRQYAVDAATRAAARTGHTALTANTGQPENGHRG
jgi:1-acyl-sn-glycerol-3-phosphate acyltransferase